MMRIALALNLLVLAPALAARAPLLSDARKPESSIAKEIREIAIDRQKATKVYRVRTAIGYPAVIEFPSTFVETPACGDCGENGLFAMEVGQEGAYLTIKPRLFPGRQANGSYIDEDEFVTTVNVRLANKLTLTIQVELADRGKADARVVFTLPDDSKEAAYVREQIERARDELQSTYQQKIEQGITEGFLKAIAAPHECRNLSARARQDNAVLRVEEICRFGAGVYVKFTVENRGRALLDIGDVSLRSRAGGKGAFPVADAKVYVDQRQLDFQKMATGVVGYRIEDGATPPTHFDLVVAEIGGKNRELVIEKFSF